MTDANLEYEGSVTIDSALLEQADIVEHEQVHVYNITNGNRLTTYAISGPPGSGTICINGAGAHLVRPGHLVIICSYAQFDEAQRSGHAPRVILVDEQNRPRD